jgi:hypothetical protein
MLRILLNAKDTEGGGDSLASQDDNGSDSSTGDTQVETQDGPEGTADDDKDVDGDDNDTGEEDSDDSSDDAAGGDKTDDQDNGQDKVEEKVEDEAPVVTDKPEDAKLDFHKHPRFQELVKEKNESKAKIDELTPLAERTRILDDYVTKNGISQQQLVNALEYTRLINSDPAKAWELLRPIANQLATFVGEVLPPDLAAEVSAGTLSEQRAKEIAMGRAQASHGQFQQQNRSQFEATTQAQQVQGAIDSWAQGKMRTDADLRPKANGDAADGKWEFLDQKLRTLRQANPPRSAQEAVSLVEKAYAEVNKAFARFVPPKQTTKPGLRSNRSNSNATPVIKTARDAVAAIMGGKKPGQVKY